MDFPIDCYEAKHDNITVFVKDATNLKNKNGTIIAFTNNGSTAELSEISKDIKIEGLRKPIYFFNRIKCKPELEGTGEGKALMIEVCKVADKRRITIYNTLNPYGKRDINSLRAFFKASGFEIFKEQSTMIRKPQDREEKGI